MVVGTKTYQCSGVRSFAYSDNTTGAILFGKSDGGWTVLNHKAFRKRDVQPTGGLQVHGTLVRICAVIIDNILSSEPFPKGKSLKEEIDIFLDRSTCQAKGDPFGLKHLQKVFRPGNQMQIFRFA